MAKNRCYSVGDKRYQAISRPGPNEWETDWRIFQCVPWGPSPEVGLIRSKMGPGKRVNSNVRYFQWIEEDGSIRNWSRSLGETIAENLR